MKTLWIGIASCALLGAFVACSDEQPTASSGAGGSAGNAGGAAGTAGSAAGSAGISGGGGSAAFDAGASGAGASDGGDTCSDPGSFYSLEAVSIDRAGPVSMCEVRGKVALVVNIAAKCGYTAQLGTLAEVQSQYLDEGLVILGFYSNQFGNQAGSKSEQLECQEKYGVNFEVFEEVNVNPPDEHPIFTWLKSQGGFGGDVQWNFEKFLLSRQGQLISRWPSAVEPDSPQMTAAIEDALAASP